MKKFKKLADKILKERPLFFKKTDAELQSLFLSLRTGEKKKELLFSILDEVCFRTKGLRPYPEQLMCVAALLEGFASDMKTGEGKSLCAALYAASCSAYGRKTHIATVNDYLAKRDKDEWESFFTYLSLTVGVNYREHPDKAAMYRKDVVYSSGAELIFDYLRNETILQNQRLNIPMECVLIDEMDFILLDNASSLFSVSAKFPYAPNSQLFSWAKEFAKIMKGYKREKTNEEEDEDPKNFHYVYSEFDKTVHLTDEGYELLEKLFPGASLYFYKILVNTLEATLFYKKERDYIVSEGKATLINQHNGRLMPDSYLEKDLHTAIEIKEGLSVTEKPLLCNSMSYQQFFIKYNSMTGMSGTLSDAKNELESLFKKQVLNIPPHKKSVRLDLPTIYFKKREEKYEYLVNLLKNKSLPFQPFLIVAGSEHELAHVYNLLLQHFPHASLLSAQDIRGEAEIIKRAGQKNTITISTNLVGRGTDIIISKEAESLGGLFVISLNHYISRRIDNQVKGRAARQGTKGACLFLSSFDDEIYQHLEREKLSQIKALFRDKKKEDRKYPLITEQLQKYLDSNLAQTRKQLFEMEAVSERIKQNVLDFKRDISEMPFDKVFLNIDEEKKVLLEKKIEEFGEETARLLYIELIEAIVSRQWLILKADMEAIRTYILNYRLPEQQVIHEYIKACFREFNSFRQDAFLQIIEYMISASRK